MDLVDIQAGGVDERVDGAELLQHLGGNGRDGCGITEIELPDRRLTSRSAHVVGDPLRGLSAAVVGERQITPSGRQLTADHLAEAAAAAGHHRRSRTVSEVLEDLRHRPGNLHGAPPFRRRRAR